MNKKLRLNTMSSLLLQVTTIICGFILPRVILGHFGTAVNGLVGSITQFLHVIAFLELGVGSVVQSALYQPLATHDTAQVSRVIKSAGAFFRRLAMILLVYTAFLMLCFPWLSRDDSAEFGWLYTALLIGAMCISSFAQYYFGVVNRLLLTADQRGYIQYSAQTVTLVLNTVACIILMQLGASIHIVKLTTSLIFLMRPLFLAWYVKRHYSIDPHITYDKEPIRQKWNGMAQHIAYVVMDSTDVIVLTLFSTLSNVSIYSVYHLVIYGVKQLFMSMTNGIQALIGELWAKQERARLETVFSWTEWSIHTGVVLIFGCAARLVVPFVTVYTHGLPDAADYIQPTFAYLIVLAHACHCLRLPYNMMIFADGCYRETQWNYFVTAILNIVISVVTVRIWGLIGVAIGTLIAMLFQTVWMPWYCSRHIMKRPMKHFIKQALVDALTFCCMLLIPYPLSLTAPTYFGWALLAVEVFALFFAIVSFINWLFYRQQVRVLCGKLTARFTKRAR